MTPEEALAAIAKVINDHLAVEQHQRTTGMSTTSIMDAQAYAFAQVVEIMKPYLDEA